MSTVSIAHLRKTYGQFVAVDDLSLDIPSGCVFGLLGPNGSGKTTTFKCALGLARRDAGDIRYDNVSLVPQTFERIAYVPEKSVLFEGITVAEHMELTRRSFARFDVKRCAELLAGFGIDPRKRVRVLSKGMKTATAVALAFARTPDIMILDEPTSGLDPINQRVVLNLIVEASANGTTVVFSSHQIGQVERAAERIAIIDRGTLILEGAVDDLKARRKIVEGVVDEHFSVDGFAGDARVAYVEHNGRIIRLHAISNADDLAAELSARGAIGVRVLDLGLEDIFFQSVSTAASRPEA